MTAAERARLAEIATCRTALAAETRALYDAARHRARVAAGAVTVETPSGHVFAIDQADADLIAPFRWFAVCHTLKDGRRRTPYIQGKINGRRVYLHRFLTGAPVGHVVDHIDGDPLNNCRANLRVVSHRQNANSYKINMDEPGLENRKVSTTL